MRQLIVYLHLYLLVMFKFLKKLELTLALVKKIPFSKYILVMSFQLSFYYYYQSFIYLGVFLVIFRFKALPSKREAMSTT